MTDSNNRPVCMYKTDLGEHCAYINGEIPAEGALHFEETDLAWGTYSVTLHFKDGMLHRMDGPAVEALNVPAEEMGELDTPYFFKGLPVTVKELMSMQTEIPASLMAIVLGSKHES